MNRAERRKQGLRNHYELVCAICRESWKDTTTLGEIHRTHFRQMHDTEKIRFTLIYVTPSGHVLSEKRLN